MLYATVSSMVHTYLLHPLTGSGYQWWSGAGSDLGEITILGALLVGLRKVNCQSPRCWRIGHHRTADGLHHLCAVHHPDLPGRRLSLAEIHLRHRTARANPQVPRDPQP